MASEIALAIAKRNKKTASTVGAMRLADDVDVELNEIREVLSGLGPEHHRHFHADILIQFEQCSHARCKRIRELMARLRVDGGKGE